MVSGSPSKGWMKKAIEIENEFGPPAAGKGLGMTAKELIERYPDEYKKVIQKLGGE